MADDFDITVITGDFDAWLNDSLERILENFRARLHPYHKYHCRWRGISNRSKSSRGHGKKNNRELMGAQRMGKVRKMNYHLRRTLCYRHGCRSR